MRAALLAVAAAVAALAAPAVAHAFPELAVRTDAARCTACHVGPAGGGLINGYGRMEAVDTLSRTGDGAPLLLPPDWLVLGADVRGAALINADRGETEGLEYAFFPMQADLRAAISAGDLSVVGTVGLRGSARLYDRGALSLFASAEHYAMWRKGGDGLYLRAGRFMPVYGLRLPDHTTYVRRATGLGLYEETYGAGGGYLGDTWEVHASGFVHDPVLDVGRREAGGALHLERHGERWHLGASARAGYGDDGLRTVAGLSARGRLGEHHVVLAEADWIHLRSEGPEATGGTAQIAWLAAVDLRLTQGVQLMPWVEQLQSAALVADATRSAAGLALKYYPRAHWEVIADTRWQLLGTDADEVAGRAMLQVHYYY